MSDIALTPGATRAYHLDREPHPENGTALGFWLYLMSDCLIFAALFATYGVLGRSYAAGPTGAQLFDLTLVAINTAFLLLSSITFGFAMLRKQQNDVKGTLVWLAVTGFFGLCFLGLELYEFAHLIHQGATPQRSAFLSAFFTLVGTHGLHVTFGLIWLVALVGVIIELATALKYKKLSLGLYLGMGWLVIIAIQPMLNHVDTGGLLLLLAGGLSYSFGVIFYAWKRLFMHHAIWHLFVLGGSVLHFLAEYWYVLPAPATFSSL